MAECPHCRYPLPEPSPRFCPSCGHDLGGETPPPFAGATGLGTPWERRRTIGIAAGLTETTQQVLTGPERFFHAMPVTGGINDPLLYGMIVSYVGLVAATIYNAVFNATFGSALAGLGNRPEFERLAPLLHSGGGLIVNLLFGPIFIAVGLFVSAGILHLLLMLLGGGARGFEGTFRVVGYAAASNLLQIIPLCGGLLGLVYSIVLLIIGLSAAHGDSKGKAAAAVLIPFVLCCCCCAALFAAIFGSIASVASQMR
jgi:hypothetical protein